jgi:hypothetical protein
MSPQVECSCIRASSEVQRRNIVADIPSLQVLRLVGVYHASGTPWGELSYWLKARLGRAHCALCDITHGSVREKAEWRQCRSGIPVAFVTVHLDERDPELTSFTDGRTPCVVAETAAGLVMLVDFERLDACAGSPACLVETIDARSRELGLVLAGS